MAEGNGCYSFRLCSENSWQCIQFLQQKVRERDGNEITQQRKFGPVGTSIKPQVCAPPGDTSVQRKVEADGGWGGGKGDPDLLRVETRLAGFKEDDRTVKC